MATLPSGLPDIIPNDEVLARFLTQSGHFNSIMPKPAAFLPSLTDRETSVVRHGGQPLNELWAIGAEAGRDRQIYGAAVFKARIVREAQLDVIADEPPPRHAAIRGWPLDADPQLQKAKQKERASIIASQAKLLLQ